MTEKNYGSTPAERRRNLKNQSELNDNARLMLSGCRMFLKSVSASKLLKSDEKDHCITVIKKLQSELTCLQYFIRDADRDQLNRGLCPTCGGRVMSVEGGNVCMSCGEMSGCF